MRYRRYIALGLLGTALLLSACGSAVPMDEEKNLPPEELITEQTGEIPDADFDPEVMAEALYVLKTDYIGDASACGSILQALGMESLGGYTMALQTEKEPYGITVHLTPDESLAEADIDAYMSRCGYLFLALVDNAERFAWDYETADGTHSRHVDDSFQVKPYAQSEESFRELCQVVELLARAEHWPADVLISSGSDDYVMRGADDATISALWAGVKSLDLERSGDDIAQDDALNLLFYDEDGQLLSAWSFYGDYCRTEGGAQLYKVSSDRFSYRNVRWVYEFSRISEDYAEGVYTPRS